MSAPSIIGHVATLPTSASAVVEVRVSADAARLLTNAGGLVIDIRSREAAPGGQTPHSEDLEIERFLIDHPLAGQGPSDPIAATLLQCDLLDHLGVPMGNKAIGIFMHRRWSEDLAQRFGAARTPSTLRRWRTSGHRPTVA
ncbi:hypothetical protein [Sphingomonas panni]|uniref:hypothetical protein n=1 Tax=Sphingomonas panni TaxID=237612 RepID=UPI001F5B5683|nr:hypothetical protein [Sphingomonas panni]